MDCTKLILEKNQKINKSGYQINFEGGKIVIKINDKWFSDDTVRKIIGSINFIHQKYRFAKIPISFVFSNIDLVDKITYTVFECICKSLIEDYGHKLDISFQFGHNILTEGINSSPLMILQSGNRGWVSKSEKFLKKFNSEIYMKHFRKVLKLDDCNGTDKVSKIFDDVVYFQKSFNINYECIEEISEVIVELLGNSIEHSSADCLLDFDIAPGYVNKNNEPFCGVNISILNISDILLGDGLKNKIHGHNLEEDKIPFTDRYLKVVEAYHKHSSFFDSEYDETDFFNISAFQHKISGRKDNNVTGGTGLTKLIKSIEERSDAHSCYVLSGDRKILLNQEYLQYNSDEWIGFNSENNYIDYAPSKSVLRKSKFYFPGTAYNLNFIMKVND